MNYEMSDNMTPEEILLAAAEDQAKHGNTKGSFYKADVGGLPPLSWREQPACALGSIARVSGKVTTAGYVEESTLDREVVIRLANTIVRHTGLWNKCYPGAVISGFNDDPSTTAEDVILMMKRAAADE